MKIVVIFTSLILFPIYVFAADVAYLQKGDDYLNKGLYDESIEECLKALKINPDNASIYNLMGLVYSKEASFCKPLEYYLKAVNNNPDDYKSQYNLGIVYENNADLDNALIAYKKAAAINPSSYEALHSIADAYGEKGYFLKETEFLKRAFLLKPDSFDVFYISKIPYGREVLYNKAIKNFQKAIKINKCYFEAYQNLGELYLHLARIYAYEAHIDRAIKCWLHLLHLAPNNADVNFQLGFLYRLRARNNYAVRYFKKSIVLGYDAVENSYYNLGEIAKEKHQYDIAIYYYKKAIECGPGHFNAYYKLGRMYVLKKDKTEALKQVDKLYELGRIKLAGKLKYFIDSNF